MSENVEILQGLLRGEWGFQGAIVSDFEGIYSCDAPVKAGVDIEMPGPPLHRGAHLVEAVKDGRIAESQIDELARHVIELAAKVGMDDGTKPEAISQDHQTSHLMRTIAMEGIVLLKRTKTMSFPYCRRKSSG